ncbi:MAG: hypothetical protein JRD71_11120 [Deltaproteobacteria bacterium]|nr:hypothetical protein [Deltaproteobacteria bacterium]
MQVSEDSEAMSRRTETAYKAQSPGKLAPHNEALDSGDRVNAALGVSLWSLTCIAKVHVLIQGDLSDMRSFDSAMHGNMQSDQTEVSSNGGRSCSNGGRSCRDCNGNAHSARTSPIIT